MLLYYYGDEPSNCKQSQEALFITRLSTISSAPNPLRKFYVRVWEDRYVRFLYEDHPILVTELNPAIVFMFTEPIVTCLAVYISIVYGTLYALFSAYPIVFQQHRGFSPGEGGLAFLGVGLGIVTGTSLTPVQNRIYWRAMDANETGRAPPEA